MEMCYDGALVMPSRYAVMDNDEMTYVEGGGKWYIPRGIVAAAVDAVGLIFCPYFAPLKFVGKSAAKALVKVYLPALAGVFRKLVTTAIGVGINVTTGTLGNILFSNAWCLTSVGGMVSLVADIVSDGSCNKRISFS